MRCAGQTHLAWTQVLWSLFVQGRRMDPRILFVRNSGRGQLQKPPQSSVDRRAFLAPGKGYRKGARERGTNLFLYLRSWPIIFLRTLFPALGSPKEPRVASRSPSPLYSRPIGAHLRNCRLSLLVASPSASFSWWPRERIALDLLRLRSWAWTRACTTHAFSIHTRRNGCTSVREFDRVVLRPAPSVSSNFTGTKDRAHSRCPLLVLMTADKRNEWKGSRRKRIKTFYKSRISHESILSEVSP